MKRPVVLALNPSVDVEWQVDHVRWEEKNNVLRERRWAGGKGVNVARWLRYLGAKPELILPLGGDSDTVGDEESCEDRGEKAAESGGHGSTTDSLAWRFVCPAPVGTIRVM